MALATWVVFLVATRLSGVKPATFNIAWLAPKDGIDYLKASSSMGGLALAINQVVADPTVLSGDNFNVKYKDSGCSSPKAVGAVYDILIAEVPYPDVIIGPPCSAAMEYIGQLAGYRNLPIVGWVSADADFGDKEKYNTLIRVLPSLNVIAQGLMTILARLGYKHVLLVANEQYPYSALGSQVDAEMTAKADQGYNVERFVQGVALGADDAAIRTIYEHAQREARIVILCVPAAELRAWLLVAYDMGMTSGDYVFIFPNAVLPTDSVVDGLVAAATWQGSDGRDDSAKSAFENLLLLTASTPFSSSNTFFASADAAASSLTLSTGLVPTAADNYSPYLHDALRLYAKLADEAGVKFSNGTYLLALAKNRILTGSEWVTGPMVLDENADRRPEFWLYDLGPDGVFRRVQETQTSLVSGVVTTTVVDIEDITWGDGSKGLANAPKDIPDCGFSNEKCPDLVLYIAPPVVSVVVIVVCLVIFFVYRRYQFEQSLKEMSWKIAAQDLERSKKGKDVGSALLKLSRASSLRGSRTSGHRGLADKSVRASAARLSALHGPGDRADTASYVSAEEAQVFISTAQYKGAPVAIKLIRKNKLKIDREILVELMRMTEVKHSNLNKFIGATTEPPEIYEVWEYCSKGSLQDIIWNDNIKLDDMFKFSIAIDICKALKYLHDSPLKVHGKLKSSNCVIDGRWVCKLTDYGLVKFKDGAQPDPEMSEEKKLSGMYWTAPELLRDWQVSTNTVPTSHEGDIYATAIILKEIFARSGPYSEYDELEPQEIIDNVKSVKDSPFRPSLVEVKGMVPDKLLEIIQTGWSEHTGERPSVAHVMRALQRINPYKSANVMDNMMNMMERYTNNLEEIVQERTVEVEVEKKKSEMLLFRMLPKPIAEDLKLGRPIQPESYESVSIYFSDIVSFTSLSASSTPMQVVTLLNGLYTVFDSAIANHDVYKVETIGDAYMLVSGLPVRNGDQHAVEITNAAMDLLCGVQKFHVEHKPDYKLKIRIGLHTGPVVAGVVGATMPRYCLFGNTVSVASLMESGGAPMRIHMSQNTHQGLSKFSGYHLAERATPFEIKGKPSIKTYFLVKRDNYDQAGDYPDYEELAAEDNPPTKRLPVTKGKRFRTSVTRPSMESGVYDVDAGDVHVTKPETPKEEKEKDAKATEQEAKKASASDKQKTPADDKKEGNSDGANKGNNDSRQNNKDKEGKPKTKRE